MTTVTGTFEVTPAAEPPLDDADGLVIGRMRFDKTFTGSLEASSVVYMTSAMTPVEGSAAYVAIEKITGSLAGRAGSFAVVHVGAIAAGEQTLAITVVADSGTRELTGITGSMTIDMVGDQHHYTLTYQLSGA